MSQMMERILGKREGTEEINKMEATKNKGSKRKRSNGKKKA
jgi:hypothetical protein